ncbi:MAG: hypothetical protein KBB71_06635 [Lentimicrobiaceae bacterium]|nr:hypothetical protein [Lentimicrobiaceae bacterium]
MVFVRVVKLLNKWDLIDDYAVLALICVTEITNNMASLRDSVGLDDHFGLTICHPFGILLDWMIILANNMPSLRDSIWLHFLIRSCWLGVPKERHMVPTGCHPWDDKFQWQEGYGAFSYAKSQKQNVINYIKNQEEHHRKRSFRDEYIELLERYEIPYDERYIFDFKE